MNAQKIANISKVSTIVIVSLISLYVLAGNMFSVYQSVNNDKTAQFQSIEKSNNASNESENESSQDEVISTFFALSPNIKLGLDIKGGSQLLLSVDINKFMQEKYASIVSELKDSLWAAKIHYKKLHIEKTPEGNTVIILETKGKTNKTFLNVRKVLQEIDGNLIVINQNEETMTIGYPESVIAGIMGDLMDQSIKIVRSRVDIMGTQEIAIQRTGSDKILLQMPGVYSPEKLKRLLGKTAKLSFHIVKGIYKPEDANGYIEEGNIMLEGFGSDKSNNYKVKKTPELEGEHLVDARANVEKFKPVIQFRLNSAGGAKFAKITEANVGQPLAIVLDEKVLTAPIINEPILGGTGIISGKFTLDEAQETADLLRSGALPAPIKIIEERTIGPSLGKESIDAAKIGSAFAIALVIVFMCVYYKYLGLVASFAIILNLSVAVSIMAIFGTTLTLPGIAGLILTLGMSVDANVLIYERMRDEIRSGKSNPAYIVAEGFKGAWSAILDSNVTTILSALALIVFGSGFIRGFAISLSIGIMCSLFSSIIFSKTAIEFLFVRLGVKFKLK